MKVCSFQRSQWRAQICHLQAAITCRQQNRGSRRAGVGRGQTGVRCLYFPFGGLWLLWSLCHTTISNSSNSNAEGVEWETKSSYFSVKARQKDRLARREKETESNGGGKSLCDSSLEKKELLRVREVGLLGHCGFRVGHAAFLISMLQLETKKLPEWLMTDRTASNILYNLVDQA